MQKVKVFLTGATGLLGEHLIKSLPTKYFLVGTYHRVLPRLKKDNVTYMELDLSNLSAMTRIIEKIKPQVILHTASIGNVDYCENHKKEAKKININATKNLFLVSRVYKSKFVFFSTNAIFDGKNPPYNEESEPNPLDYYGITKTEIENYLQKQSPNTQILILRLTTMYGWHHPQERKNPVTWFLEELSKNHELKVVDDTYNNFLYAKDAATAVWRLLSAPKDGKYNIAGPETVSRFELAQKAALVFGLPSEKIKPVPSSFFPSLAPRPKNTTFDISKITRDIWFKPKHIIDGLKDMKRAKV